MKKGIKISGLSFVFIIMSILIYFLNIESYRKSLELFTFMILIDILFIGSIFRAFYEISEDEIIKINFVKELYSFIFILLGSLSVFIVLQNFDFNEVIVVALVSLLAGIFLKHYAKEVVIGTFLGMGSFFSGSYLVLIVAVIIAYIVNFLIKDLFNGLGGKLGTTAFVGGLMTFYLFSGTSNEIFNYKSFNIIYVIIISMIASIIPYFFNNYLNFGAIISYSIVSIIGGIFLLFPETNNLGFINVVFGASFIGMSSNQEIKNYYIIIIASLIFSLFIVTGKSFTNIGGRGGTLSLISVFIANNLKDLFLISKHEKETLFKNVF